MDSKLEPFITYKEVVSSGLFPGLKPESLRAYTRKGLIKAYGPKRAKCYLLSEVYEDWKKIKRGDEKGSGDNGRVSIQERAKSARGGLSKEWKAV